MLSPRFWVLVSATVAVAATRLVPHPDDFTPVGAVCLLSGAYLMRRWEAFAIPLGAMLLSDLVLAGTRYDLESLKAVAPMYWSFALTVCLGMLLRGRERVLPITTAAICAALLHHFITNFAFWAMENWYPHTWQGLITCFVAALPFLRNMLLGNLVFCAILFGAFAWAKSRYPALRERPEAAAG